MENNQKKSVGNVDRMILIRLRMSVSVCEYIYMDREKTRSTDTESTGVVLGEGEITEDSLFL